MLCVSGLTSESRTRFGKEGFIEFEEMDAFDMGAVLRLQQRIQKRFNKIFIDINGSRDIGTVYDCLDKYQKVLKPELIVLKSIKVRTLLHQCIPWEEDESTAGCNSDGGELVRVAAEDKVSLGGTVESRLVLDEDTREISKEDLG